MRRRYSHIAGEIIRDIKLEESYKKKQRAKCKEKDCSNCQYEHICTESERKDEI